MGKRIKICKVCKKEFTPDRQHSYQKYCSANCRNKARHNRERGPEGSRTKRERDTREKIICGICGVIFTPSNEHKRYCSDQCSKESDDRKTKQWSENHKVVVVPTKRICKWCGVEFETIGKRQCCCDEHSYQYLHGREKPRERDHICEWCGESYTTRYSKSRACCDKHAKKLNKFERKQRQRAIIHVPYSRREIFTRDNFICHICGASIDMNAVAPHPYSPSIDHVIPIKHGGADTPENVRAAHFICNSIKSDRILQ